MIHGIGVDIVSIKRIADAYNNDQNRFVDRILSADEIQRFHDTPESLKIRFLAKRFAAKEAYAKAYGTGIRGALSFKSIDIAKDDMGRPYFTNNTMHSDGFVSHLSITDEEDFAVAYVVLEV